jgi:hypothetical protein
MRDSVVVYSYLVNRRDQMKNRLTSSFGIFLLMVFGSVIASAQVTITLPNPSTGPNTSLMIPVNVSSLTGLNVVSYEFTAICDTTFVKFTGVDVAGTVSNGLSPLANYYVNGFNAGRMKVVCATIAPLSGSGVLLNLKATTQNLGGTTPIQLTGLILGESIPFTLTNGTVTITGGLRPPTITPVSAKTVAEVDTLRFTVVATDTNGLALNYSSSNLPIGATLGSSTGQFVWRPDYSQAGSYSPRIKVTNTGGAADSIVVAITVTNVNRKPVFNPVSAKTIKSSDTMSVVLSAVDPDNDPLTYSFVSITPSASTSPSVSGNILRWIPAFADIGRTYSLTVRVSDNIITGGGVLPGADTLVVSVTVTAGVRPPTITPVGAKTVAEADTLRFTVVATNTNGLALTYSSSNLPLGATLGSSTGQFVWRPDYTQAGSYSPRMKVTNTGGAADSIVVAITVTNVNRKPVFNPISAKTVKDSDTMSVALSAVDPDNDPLTYSFVSMSP